VGFNPLIRGHAHRDRLTSKDSKLSANTPEAQQRLGSYKKSAGNAPHSAMPQ
jgi:hypothetical protein